MTQPSVAAPQPFLPVLRPYWRAIAPLALLALAAVVLRPNLALLGPVSPAIKIHLAAAVGALFLGAVMLASRKGRTFHRIAGWSWVIIMATVAVSSIFIHEINPGHFSWIHGFTALTLSALPLGVVFARRHNVKAHCGTMMGLYLGGLVIAGLFTFVPGRLMFQMFFGG
jgi:uncharacterized membrane protein